MSIMVNTQCSNSSHLMNLLVFEEHGLRMCMSGRARFWILPSFSCIFSMEQPKIEPYTLTRFLVEDESTGILLTLALNKTELVEKGIQKLMGQDGHGKMFIQ